ncbi:unnamed protein product [Trichogramma brassicae]|uniref:Uncharacterized protein n=1 Tax=Trichogramma brassicae TaxID=86971 RepID=A0A6H5IVM9_9HYME|nr:unnamed protein product [Trichogramma brassicae]
MDSGGSHWTYSVLSTVSEGSVSLSSTFTLRRPRPHAMVKSRSRSFLTEDSGRPSTRVVIGSCPSLAGTSLYKRHCPVPSPGQMRSMRWNRPLPGTESRYNALHPVPGEDVLRDHDGGPSPKQRLAELWQGLPGDLIHLAHDSLLQQQPLRPSDRVVGIIIRDDCPGQRVRHPGRTYALIGAPSPTGRRTDWRGVTRALSAFLPSWHRRPLLGRCLGLLCPSRGLWPRLRHLVHSADLFSAQCPLFLCHSLCASASVTRRLQHLNNVAQRRHPQATCGRQLLSIGHFEPHSIDFGRSASAAWIFRPQLARQSRPGIIDVLEITRLRISSANSRLVDYGTSSSDLDHTNQFILQQPSGESDFSHQSRSFSGPYNVAVEKSSKLMKVSTQTDSGLIRHEELACQRHPTPPELCVPPVRAPRAESPGLRQPIPRKPRGRSLSPYLRENPPVPPHLHRSIKIRLDAPVTARIRPRVRTPPRSPILPAKRHFGLAFISKSSPPCHSALSRLGPPVTTQPPLKVLTPPTSPAKPTTASTRRKERNHRRTLARRKLREAE